MSAQPGAVTRFVRAWTPELVKSIEMFTGSTVSLENTAVPTRTTRVGEPMTWFAQPFERGATGDLWIGLPSAAVATLMTPIGDDPGEQTALLQELLREALRGAAHVLGTSGYPGLACADAFREEPPAAAVETDSVWLAIGDDWIRFDIAASAEFAALLTMPDAPPARPVAPAGPAGGAAEPGGQSAFDRFSGVDLPVAIVLGRATMCIRDVLKLGVGSLIELDRHVSDPVEVCVNDTVIARGEVVSIRGNYGVRVLEVLTPRERMHLRSGTSRPSSAAGDRPQVH